MSATPPDSPATPGHPAGNPSAPLSVDAAAIDPTGVQAVNAGGLRRSRALFAAFRVEQTDPDRFYSLLAHDTVRLVGAHAPLRDAKVVDVGGGPGYFADAFRAAGAHYAGIDPDAGELTARGGAPEGFLRASGMALPLASQSLDVCMSSNVLEHVPNPELMGSEMLRVVRPGGIAWLSWTPWWSPWGGHETAPWHYLGGHRAANRYAKRQGRRPKNDFGLSLYALSAARMRRWAAAMQAEGQAEVLDVHARYHPGWARPVAKVPVISEVASWNVVIVLRRR